MSIMGRCDDRRGGRRRVGAGALAAMVVLALASGAGATGPAEHAKRSGAERAFATAYTALVPRLNAASGAVLHALANAGKETDAQIVTVFTAVAKQWHKATRPLLALRAPAPETRLFAAVTRQVPALESDLLAAAQAGRTHDLQAATAAGRHIVLNFNALAAAVKALKKKLGLA